MTYEQYKTAGGKLSEEEFDELIDACEELIEGYAASLVPYWKLDEALDFLKESEKMNKALALQIEFIQSIGGISVFNGQSDLNLSSVSTSGFTYQYSNSSQNKEAQMQYFNGVPLSPLFQMRVENELRKNGFLYRGLV